jgi:asparagine synthase (glutamine-hydrolysing)
MCGIVGVYRGRLSVDSDPWDDGRFDRMMRFIAPRGPDQDGRWRSDDGAVQFGHTRLSILDLSEHGRQPYHSASGRSVVTFNGEIYNHRDLAARLRARGWIPRSSSDTEVLVEYAEAFGVDALLSDADGMFAFGLFDVSRKELFLARDRFGEKPLFWGVIDGALVFGSDLRSLGAYSRVSPTLNPGAVREYLHWGYVPDTETIWLGMSKLRPGQVLRAVVEPERISVDISTYFNARAESRRLAQSRRKAPSDDELEEMLRRTVAERMDADVPLGALLSGGIDSSLVVALMRSTGRDVKTFSIGFENDEYNEAHFAKRVAEHLGTEHRELYLSESDVLAAVPKLAGLLAEPIADSSLLPTYLVSKFAREHVTVALSGDGGDEMFGGYSRYARLGGMAKVLSYVPPGVRSLGARSIGALSRPEFSEAVNWLSARTPKRFRLSRPQHKLAKLGRLLNESSLSAAYESLVMTGAASFISPSRRSGAEPFDSDWLASARMHDTLNYLPDDICVKVDRASMGVGLELRAPLLGREVFDSAWSYVSEDLMKGAQGKLPLRRILLRYLPADLFERPKMGFGIPVNEWTGGPLREPVAHAIETLSTRDVFRMTGVNEGGIRHWAKTEANAGSEVWSLLILGEWLREAG